MSYCYRAIFGLSIFVIFVVIQKNYNDSEEYVTKTFKIGENLGQSVKSYFTDDKWLTG